MEADAAIAIVDCNNFYASCERVVNPELQNRPVVVLSHNDRIIVSRSNEVKALGVPNASPFVQHRELLDFERRHSLSKIIDEVNYRYGRDIVRFAALEARGD